MKMRWLAFAALTVAASIPAFAADALPTELLSLHDRWLSAYDRGDGRGTNACETDDLVLILPNGFVWTKTSSRPEKSDPTGARTRELGDVHVRTFGDTAILTGVLTSTFPAEVRHEAETVVFVRRDGQWRIASAQWTNVEGQ